MRLVTLVSAREMSVSLDWTPAERVLFIANAQRGRVARRQCLAAGLSESAVDRSIRRLRLVVVHSGVYAVGHELAPAWGDEVAALLAVGRPVALSHRSAGALWGICRSPPPSGVDVVVPGNRAKSRPGIRVYRSRSLPAADVTTRLGIPVTTPARTLLDLAEHADRRAVERAFDEALARRLISPTKIGALIARSHGRKGCKLLAELADPARATGITREAAEERMLLLIRQAGLPDPARNVAIGPYVVDMLWPDDHVVIEIDSFRWHSGPAVFKRDRRKDAYLTDHGHAVHRVTWEMMDAPLPLVARLARAIAAA